MALFLWPFRIRAIISSSSYLIVDYFHVLEVFTVSRVCDDLIDFGFFGLLMFGARCDMVNIA